MRPHTYYELGLTIPSLLRCAPIHHIDASQVPAQTERGSRLWSVSSEVVADSREENASNKECRANQNRSLLVLRLIARARRSAMGNRLF
jgi:hypothetical protein